MTHLTGLRRSGSGVLAAGALVASLLAAGASPVGAEIDTADHATRLSACVGAALGDQMFTDVSDGHAFGDHINCVAYYGITSGTGDGSTYSPDRDVTRAEMAVFIARAAGVAGVDLGDAGRDEFDDIGDTWQEARDAINRLAGNGMIASGGDFRPMDAITRAEMASFLVGLLAAAAPNVTIDSGGAIKLGESDQAEVADDHFGDVRATKPAAADAQTAALYELGITKGASAAAGAEDGKAPIDYHYEPDGTVDRGQMAAFITRALAHTSVRPAGVSAQFDGTHVRVSVRDSDFQPEANAVVDMFRTDAPGVDLAFRASGSCSAAVGKISATGTYVCEIDGDDPITDGDGEISVELDGGVDDGGTVVWVWTGDPGDIVGADTNLYRLDIAEREVTAAAIHARVRRESPAPGKLVHLDSSALYSVQLEDADGAVSVGIDGEKPANFIITLATYESVLSARSQRGPAGLSMLPLTTDSDGRATFSVSGLFDQNPDAKGEKYIVDIFIEPDPDGGNIENFVDRDGVELVPLPVAAEQFAVGSVTFSTAPSGRDLLNVTVLVESANDFIVASARGAVNRATVFVSDQYDDPIPGAQVWLTSSLDGVTIGSGRAFAVGRDGTHTFSYVRESDDAASETLTANWDHDGDGCLAGDSTNTALTSWNVHLNNDDDTTNDVTWDHDGDSGTDEVLVTRACYDERPVIDLDDDGSVDQPGTAGDTRDILEFKGTSPASDTATVAWAKVPGIGDSTTNDPVLAFDLETDTIFVGTLSSVVALYYDSNDRFNVGPSAGSEPPATYAEFERALATSVRNGYPLDWEIHGSGTKAANEFTLTTS